jgi:hypothetical protein
LVFLTADIIIFSKTLTDDSQSNALGAILILLLISALLFSCYGIMFEWRQRCHKTDQEIFESNTREQLPSGKANDNLQVFGLDVFSRKADALQRIEKLFSVHGLNAMKNWAEAIEEGDYPPKLEMISRQVNAEDEKEGKL